MATLPAKSLLARSRSTRAGNENGNSSIKPPHATHAASHQVPAVSTNFSVFLTNLRLLDLDLLPDWPGFDAQALAAQKKRIQSIEWALYQLFALWDPDETHSARHPHKLESYFPPRDQVQSINLRSALLRCLEQAKKNGVLGRDAVVRRTMLDDCKGERLEEVLAAFSSAVLKKLAGAAAEAERDHPAVAQRLALENRGHSGDDAQLKVLVLAHKVSLSRTLRQKNQARRQYGDLAELLALKERTIVRRQEQLASRGGRVPGDKITEDMRREASKLIRNNWAGNERWMETLLRGDASDHQDGLLSAPFDRVWRRVQSDRLSDLDDSGMGLLQQLEGRVKAQKASLRKWQDFQREMFGNEDEMKPRENDKPKIGKRGIDLGFNSHEHLHLGRLSPTKQLSTGTPALSSEYEALIDECQAELAQVGVPKTKELQSFLGPRTRQPARPETATATLSVQNNDVDEDTTSEPSEVESDVQVQVHSALAAVEETHEKTHGAFSTHDSQLDTSDTSKPKASHLSPKSSTSRRPRLGRNPSSTSVYQPAESLSHPSMHVSASSGDRSSSRSKSRSPQRTTKPSIIPDDKQQSPSPEPASPTTEMADQILASLRDASPSPIKNSKPRHTLSLAERTRVSMARMSRGGNSFDLDLDDQTDDFGTYVPGSASPSKPQAEDDAKLEVHKASEVGPEDLASRTRRSLAGFEAARQKAQLERRKSQRKSRLAPRKEGSYFPKLQEEETTTLDVDQSVLAEELMEGKDMDAVFKSRPRLQTSPAPSPGRHWDDDEN